MMPSYEHKLIVHKYAEINSSGLLLTAFTWDATREGSTYWGSVYARLGALAENEYLEEALPIPRDGTNSESPFDYSTIVQLLDFIDHAFLWCQTKEDYSFWKSVHDNVQDKLDFYRRLLFQPSPFVQRIVQYILSEGDE